MQVEKKETLSSLLHALSKTAQKTHKSIRILGSFFSRHSWLKKRLKSKYSKTESQNHARKKIAFPSLHNLRL